VEIFTNALHHENANFVYVEVKMEGFEGRELITNPRENFQKKLEYYDRAYDEDLKLKANPGIQITAYGWAETLESIDYYVNDKQMEVAVILPNYPGEVTVFAHESDAQKFVEKRKMQGDTTNYYIDVSKVTRCGITII
jgi:hypothetical protein